MHSFEVEVERVFEGKEQLQLLVQLVLLRLLEFSRALGGRDLLEDVLLEKRVDLLALRQPFIDLCLKLLEKDLQLIFALEGLVVVFTGRSAATSDVKEIKALGLALFLRKFIHMQIKGLLE